MDKRIIWADQASGDLVEILEYWNKITGSKNYSFKLYRSIKETLKVIMRFPEIGKPIENHQERYFVKEHYLIVYLADPSQISVLKIWDTRRNTEKFNS